MFGESARAASSHSVVVGRPFVEDQDDFKSSQSYLLRLMLCLAGSESQIEKEGTSSTRMWLTVLTLVTCSFRAVFGFSPLGIRTGSNIESRGGNIRMQRGTASEHTYASQHGE